MSQNDDTVPATHFQTLTISLSSENQLLFQQTGTSDWALQAAANAWVFVHPDPKATRNDPSLNMVTEAAAVAEIIGVGSAPYVNATQPNLALNSSAIALAVPQADAAYLAATGTVLAGTGLKIGIISDSFNLDGGEAGAITAGALPPASDINIVEEGSSGKDEGMAMAEMIHAIAPGATLYFYTGTNSEQDFADGIDTLTTIDQVNEIVDDVLWSDEPFFQNTGVINAAIEGAIASGVDYFTAANNNSNNFYEANFSPMTFNLPGLGIQTVHDVTNGSPFEAVYLNTNPTINFALEWTEPYGDAQYDIGVALYSFNSASDTYNLVTNWAVDTAGGNPYLSAFESLTLTAGTYYFAFYENDSELINGAPITPGLFKIILLQGSNATLTGVGAGQGSGTSMGHELLPAVNTVAAVNVSNTPAYGQTTPTTEGFSANGPGYTYLDANGNTLTPPINDGKPDFAATDGSATTTDLNPFYGTSAAAPNAAAVGLLLLQADPRLTTSQMTNLLEQSAIPTSNSVTGGAGLIQANTAVAAALNADVNPVWTAADGSELWNDPLNWSDDAVPGAASDVQISDGLGAFQGAFEQVVLNDAIDAIGSLFVGPNTALPSGSDPVLQIASGDELTTDDIMLGNGTLAVYGTLVDFGTLQITSSEGLLSLVGAGAVSIAGALSGGDIFFSATGGNLALETSNAATLLNGLDTDILNFRAGDTIDLAGLPIGQVANVKIEDADVTLVDGQGDTLAALTIYGQFRGLGVTADSGGGTELVACFVSGTRILTPDGACPIEAMKAGDWVLTASGEARRVSWIGQCRYKAAQLAALPHLRPIAFRPGSLGGGVPHRPLLVSPEHAMLLDGVLVPAQRLINGKTILPDPTLRDVVYFHLELDTHDVILAEGAASETFVDRNNRHVFDNPPPPRRGQTIADCAKRIETGPVLDRIRRRLDYSALQEIRLDRPGHHRIALRDAVRAVRLRSPTAHKPQDARRLGAALTSLGLDGNAVDLGNPSLAAGWHRLECHFRWNDGDAVVLVPQGTRWFECEVAALASLN